MYSGLFNSDNKPLLPGLFFTCYNGYMNDNVSFFNTASPIATSKTTGKPTFGATSNISTLDTGTNGCISTTSTPQSFSIQWLGYFKPNVTSSTWYFRTTSDDCSYLWIGSNAITGFTTGNANVNNGGLHGDVTVRSNAITLTVDVYYPLRIQQGGGNFNNTMKVEFSRDNVNWYSDGNYDENQRYFHS